MIYSIDAIAMLERLGISLNLVESRNLAEFTEATSLVQLESGFGGREHLLDPRAASAWQRLSTAAEDDGISIYLISAFRSIQRQTEIIENKIRQGLSIEQILEFSAPPFFSEHHTGCAVDVGTSSATDLEQEFENTDALPRTRHCSDTKCPTPLTTSWVLLTSHGIGDSWRNSCHGLQSQ